MDEPTKFPRATEEAIVEAVDRLRRGVPVAVPTETVYGLAAPIDSPAAVEAVFRLKARPFFDPLIVHIHEFAQLAGVASEISPVTRVLMDAFWPGPCTFVLPKRPEVNPMITSGLETVAVRMPSHPVMLEILRRVGVPLAAPSANKFGRTSPTLASHVRAEWPDGEVFVVDAGAADHGLESTVLRVGSSDGARSVVEILRPGVVTAEDVEAVLASNGIPAVVSRAVSEASPGHTEHHYMPAVPLVIVPPEWIPLSAERVGQLEADLKVSITSVMYLELSEEPALAARQLYAHLHELSQTGADCIVFGASPSGKGRLWDAIWDRLQRAATKNYLQ